MSIPTKLFLADSAGQVWRITVNSSDHSLDTRKAHETKCPHCKGKGTYERPMTQAYGDKRKVETNCECCSGTGKIYE